MNALNSYVIVEPVNRNDDYSTTIKGFEYKPKHQGQPNTGYVRFMGCAIKDAEYAVGNKIIFNEPSPQGFRIDGVEYIPVTHEKVVAKCL